MNRRGVFPPKFRPQRSLPLKKKEASDDSELVMRDRQVIDMHWLHCRGKRDVVPAKYFANIFVGDELDFRLASQLASKKWKLKIKAEKSLNLLRHEQLPLAILRGKEVTGNLLALLLAPTGCLERISSASATLICIRQAPLQSARIH